MAWSWAIAAAFAQLHIAVNFCHIYFNKESLDLYLLLTIYHKIYKFSLIRTCWFMGCVLNRIAKRRKKDKV